MAAATKEIIITGCHPGRGASAAFDLDVDEGRQLAWILRAHKLQTRWPRGAAGQVSNHAPTQTGGMELHKVETTPPAAANPEPPTQTSRLFRIKPFADPQNSFGPGLQI